ncbi:type IV pilus assembly protein PilM [Holophaga foetida]|uniref:type IV pilus assembly protein PilM n=1 Tax=Holophaga foetida TaxID=35839 RepID=UPI000247507C|nr:type IV pilus assembly protein PilM [Holophaga foetida]
MGLFQSKKKLLVGLDIGSGSVKLCELQSSGKAGSQRYRLQKLGEIPIPHDAIVDGDIMDSNAVAGAIRQVVAEQKIKAKEVAISVAGQQVMVKKVTFPLMSPAELAESVRWEAESFFPAGQGLDSYALDFSILEERPADGNMDVVLVACRKDKLEAYVSCVAQAGLRPVIVDVDVFALQNAYEANYSVSSRDEVVALVNIGSSFTNLTMLTGNRSTFWRDIAWGGNRFTDKLVEDWGVSREGAELLKQGGSAEGRTAEEVQPSLMAISDGFADELTRTVDFFRSSFKVDRLDRIVVSGGGAKTSGLLEVLGDRFRVSVERMNPFQALEVDERSVDSSRVSEIGCSAAVAVGVALRQVGDR